MWMDQQSEMLGTHAMLTHNTVQVNRLTRELTALRAHSASVASNHSVSSTSTAASNSLLPIDISDLNPTHQMTGHTHPTPSRRHRSSSSMSSRSNVILTPSTMSAAGSNHAQAGSTITAASSLHGISQASADRAAAAGTISRQPSVSGRSGASTPARHSMDFSRSAILARPSISRENTTSSTLAQPGTPSLALSPTTPQIPGNSSINTAMQHYADTSAYRTEMEIVKAENDALRQRVRALEQALRTRRRDSSTSAEPHLDQRERGGSDLRTDRRDIRSGEHVPARGHSIGSPPPSVGLGVAAWAANDGGIGGVAGPRERSESQSTTASSRRGVPVPGVPDEDVRVGESASNVGVRGGGI